MPKSTQPKTTTRAIYKDKVEAALAKQFGDSAVVHLGGKQKAASAVTSVIPTGIDALDHYLLPCGGLPCGRMVEVFGNEATGKSSLGLQIIASAQKDKAKVYITDPELSFDEERAVDPFNVDLDAMSLLKPTCLEDLLTMFQVILRAHDPKKGNLLLVWDTIAATKTRKGVEAKVGEKVPAEFAAIMSTELPKLLDLLAAKSAVLLAFNQIRTLFGVRFGPNETTPGGKAVKFYASWRLQLCGGKAIKKADTGEHLGKIVTYLVVKTRFSAPYRKARVHLMYNTGFDNGATTIGLAKQLKLMDGRSAGGKAKRGKNALLEAQTVLAKHFGAWPGTVAGVAAPSLTAAATPAVVSGEEE